MKNLRSMRRLKKGILLELTKKEEDIMDGVPAKLFGENSGKFIFGSSKQAQKLLSGCIIIYKEPIYHNIHHPLMIQLSQLEPGPHLLKSPPGPGWLSPTEKLYKRFSLCKVKMIHICLFGKGQLGLRFFSFMWMTSLSQFPI